MALKISGALLLVAACVAPAAVSPALAQNYTAAIDLGMLASNTPVQVGAIPIQQQRLAWYKFTVPAVSGGTYLDIDSFGSSLAPNNDTMLGLYDSAGALVAMNDDFSGFLSGLSFGSTSLRPGGFRGQNGSLAAGTYYIALGGYPTTWGPTGWAAVSNSNNIGTGVLNFRLGVPLPVLTPLFHQERAFDYVFMGPGDDAETVGGSDYSDFHSSFQLSQATIQCDLNAGQFGYPASAAAVTADTVRTSSTLNISLSGSASAGGVSPASTCEEPTVAQSIASDHWAFSLNQTTPFTLVVRLTAHTDAPVSGVPAAAFAVQDSAGMQLSPGGPLVSSVGQSFGQDGAVTYSYSGTLVAGSIDVVLRDTLAVASGLGYAEAGSYSTSLSLTLGSASLPPSVPIDTCSFAPRADIPSMPGSENRIGVADLDGDGKPDIVVADYNVLQAFQVFRNVSAVGSLDPSSFAPAGIFPCLDASAGIAVGDIDGDARPDVVLSHANGQIEIFRNTTTAPGAVSFAPPLILTWAFGPVPGGVVISSTEPLTRADIALADMDGDGRTDIVTTRCILRNVSTPGSITGASFDPPVFAEFGEHLAVGDLDGDGRPDVVMCLLSSGYTVAAFRNTSTVGSVSLATPILLPGGAGVSGVAVADLNADARPEILICRSPDVDPATIWIWPNLASPGSLTTSSFAAPVDLTGIYATSLIAAADLNGDGMPEIIAEDQVGSQGAISIFRNLLAPGQPITTEAFASKVTYSISDLDGHGPRSIAIADLDADGKPDLAIGHGFSDPSAPGFFSVFRSSVGSTTPAVASAGSDQTVPEGSNVTLDASASRGPNGSPAQITWSQIAGPAVTLNLADPVHPAFTAPQVSVGGATLTFRVSVDDCQNGPSIPPPVVSGVVNITVTNFNHAPVASAGPNQTVSEGSLVALDASGSYDPDDDAISYLWLQTDGPTVILTGADTAHPTFTAPAVPAAGSTLTFVLSISDGQASDTGVVNVLVEHVNHPPIAGVAPGGTVDEGSLVTLNASASTDPDNDPLSYSWLQTGGTPVSLTNPATATPTFTAPSVAYPGATLTFRVTVSDGSLSSSSDTSIFVRHPLAPPNCAGAHPSVARLWPPNHKLVPVDILGVGGDPATGTLSISILSVTQNEPVNGLGDGDTAPDAIIQGSTVLIRAERAAAGQGRIYRITFQATNAGGSCTGTVTVCVPRDQTSPNGSDNGLVYNSLAH